jgi:serine/threonine-protein phosphatase PGAM5
VAQIGDKRAQTRRLVVLVRHGQYNPSPLPDGPLTPVGREQAALVAAHLARTFVFDTAFVSTLVRAKQTAALIGPSLEVPIRASSLLAEGFPTKAAGHITKNLAADQQRFEAAFARFFKAPRKRTTDLLVCHGNIIRYFVCRALGGPAKTWLRFGTNHTGITRIVVKQNGEMGVASYNETAHLPRKLVT